MTLKVLDLFSGIGGFSLGLEWTGHFKTVAFCEVNDKAAQILKKRWPGVPVFSDIRSLNKEMINEEIDIICGGFPCQDISVAGKGAGLMGERSGLWFEMHRLIKEIRPKYVIAENVSVLRSRGLDRVLGSLAEIGYDAEWHCVPASAVGAPHRRDRVWIVAYAEGGTSGHVREDDRPIRREGYALGDESRLGGLCEAGPIIDRDLARDCGADVPDARRIAAQVPPSRIISTIEIAQCAGWWSVEPDVGRVAHGIPGRVDRLKQLGNAVVPHIPMLIGQAIHEHHIQSS